MRTWTSNMTAFIRAMANSAFNHEPSLDGLASAADHLSASAHSIEAGDLASACERLVLACESMYGAISDVKRIEDLHHEMDLFLERNLHIYLDTNIVSEGIAKHRLKPEEQQEALDRILDAAQVRAIEVQTSEVMKRELDAIPPKYREPHIRVYRLVRLVRGIPIEAGGDPRQPIFDQIKRSLGAADYEHVMEAINSHSDVFLTVDGGICANGEMIAKTGMQVMSPVELVEYLQARYVIQ